MEKIGRLLPVITNCQLILCSNTLHNCHLSRGYAMRRHYRLGDCHQVKINSRRTHSHRKHGQTVRYGICVGIVYCETLISCCWVISGTSETEKSPAAEGSDRRCGRLKLGGLYALSGEVDSGEVLSCALIMRCLIGKSYSCIDIERPRGCRATFCIGTDETVTQWANRPITQLLRLKGDPKQGANFRYVAMFFFK